MESNIINGLELHHISLAIKKENLSKYLLMYQKLGSSSKLLFGNCYHYKTECYFLFNKNCIIELIMDMDGEERIKRFVEKRGEGSLHHMAFIDNGLQSKIDGALPGMKIKFLPLEETGGTLIEKVKLE